MSRCFTLQVEWPWSTPRSHLASYPNRSFRGYFRLPRPFTHGFLGNLSDPRVFRDNSSVASVKGNFNFHSNAVAKGAHFM